MNCRLFPSVLSTSRRSLIAGAAFLAMGAGATPSIGLAAEVTVGTHEPTLAPDTIRSIRGRCYGQPVQVDLQDSPGHAGAVVRVGSNTHTFGPTEEFVRQLTAMSQLSQLWLYCENGPDKRILLGVMGLYLENGVPKGTVWRGQVKLAQDGSLISFSGLQPVDEAAPAGK